MTNEQRDLLKVEYSNRFPYDQKVMLLNGYNSIHTIEGLTDKGVYLSGLTELIWFKNTKPILFPIECLTQTITVSSYNNGDSFFPLVEISKHLRDDGKFIHKSGMIFSFGLDGIFNFEDWETLPTWITNLFHKLHINYRLPEEMFVPVTDEFNPYK